MADGAQDTAGQVNAHYGYQDYGARIIEALRATGRDLQTVTADDIADATHFTRGKAPVLDLARLAGLQPGMRVLDIGIRLPGFRGRPGGAVAVPAPVRRRCLHQLSVASR